MVAGAVVIGVEEPVAPTSRLHPPEQIPDRSVPRHLRELVDGAYQQGRRVVVDLLVYDEHRQPFAVGRPLGERATALPVRAANERSSGGLVDLVVRVELE